MTLTSRLIVVWIGLCFVCSGCSITFNFSGTKGKLDNSLQTLNVETFGNEAAVVVPYLSQELTNQIQDRFLSQSRLSLTDGAADVELSGAVTRYGVSPVAVQGDETAAQSRLTIDVKVIFENNVDPEKGWTQNFSNFTDFDAEEDFTSIEADLIDEVLEQITQDIFTKSLGEW